MTARQKILASLVPLAVLGGVVWESLRSRIPDPICKGEHLSYWLAKYEPGVSFLGRDPAVPAIREAGTNAIPLLLHYISAHNSPFQRRMFRLMARQDLIKSSFVSDFYRHYQAVQGFWALGPRGKSAVPELIRIYDSNFSASSQQAVLEVLWGIGPDAKDAIPVLVHAVTNSDAGYRMLAARALGIIRVKPELIVPLLTVCLKDSDMDTRSVAVWALGNLGPPAKAAVPQLLKLRNATSGPPGEWATNHLPAIDEALLKIDPTAAANAGIAVTNVSAAQ
jgi:hypothetical protein